MCSSSIKEKRNCQSSEATPIRPCIMQVSDSPLLHPASIPAMYAAAPVTRQAVLNTLLMTRKSTTTRLGHMRRRTTARAAHQPPRPPPAAQLRRRNAQAAAPVVLVLALPVAFACLPARPPCEARRRRPRAGIRFRKLREADAFGRALARARRAAVGRAVAFQYALEPVWYA